MSIIRAASEIEPCRSINSRSWTLPGPSLTRSDTHRMKSRMANLSNCFICNEYCPEVIDIRARRSGDHEITQLFEELIGIVRVKHLLWIEIERSSALEHARV